MAGLLLGVAVGWAAQPVAEDALVVTFRNRPVSVVLTATDPDIQPSQAHPLVFTILEGPECGTISGDLADVAYNAAQNGASLTPPRRGDS